MHEIRKQSQSIGEFLEWLTTTKGVTLCLDPHEHGDECYDDTTHGFPSLCGYDRYERPLFNYNIERLLAEFFQIDLVKAENEKLAILEELRK